MVKFIRLVIADNDSDFSAGLQRFLDNQADIKVVDVVRDGQGAVSRCREAMPDLVLMDLQLPVLDSIRAIQAIMAQNERIKVLTTSAVSNDRYAVEAVKAGAYGCIEKNGKDSYELIANAIRQVTKGEVFLNPALASLILKEFHRLTH